MRQRDIGDRRVRALGGDEVEEGHHVRARLYGARRCRLAHEVDTLGPGRGRQRNEPGDHASPQDVVAQLGPVGLDPHLEVARVGHQVDQPGGRVDQADGLLGAPGQQARDENEQDREQRGDEQQPPVADGAAQVDPDDRDHGVTMPAHAGHGEPAGHERNQAQDAEGPDHRRRRVPQQRQAPEPDQGPPVGGAEAEHLEGLGQGAGRSRLPPNRASTRPTTRDAANASWGVRANEVRKAPRPHMAAVAPTHIMSTPSGRTPVGTERGGGHAPDDQDGRQPGDGDGQELPPHDGAGPDGRRGEPGQCPGGALHEERAHAEAAPDEQEDHRDGGREVVEHGLAAVAERARRQRDGGRARGGPALQPAGVQPAGQARRHRFGILLPEQRVGPVHDGEPGRGRGARGHHRDEEMRERQVAAVEDDAARQCAVRHLAPHRRLVRDPPHHDVGRELARVHGRPQQRRRGARDPDRERRHGGVPGEGEAENGGDGEGRHQAGDHGGAVAHPPAQFVEGDDEGGQPACS